MKQYRDTRGRYTNKKRTALPAVLLFGILAVTGWGNTYASIANAEKYEREQPPVVEHITLIETTAEPEHVQYVDLAVQIATEHQLNVSDFLSVIACESNWNPTIQSQHKYNFSDPDRGIVAGTQEQSYGLVQWHIPDWDITIQEAQNPVIALNRMADLWVEGKADLWTCYRHLKRYN